jgi:glycosyltransferase involved in cell wall biosynthesis
MHAPKSLVISSKALKPISMTKRQVTGSLLHGKPSFSELEGQLTRQHLMNSKLCVTQPCRLLHLVHGLNLGGLELMVKRLVEGLDPAKFHTTICCYDDCGELADDIERAGAEVIFLPRRPGVDWRYPFHLRPILRKRRIDLLHCHNHLSFVYGVPAAKLAGTPGVVYTEHGRVLPTSFRFTLANRALSRLDVYAVPVSAALARELHRVEHFPLRKMTIIPNGVPEFRAPDESVRLRLRSSMQAGGDTFLVGTVGRLEDVKNHLGLIRAMPELIRTHPFVRLAIVGGGSLMASLQEEIRRLGLTNYVVLTGPSSDVEAYFHAFDLFVLTSKNEGMPLALLEAMGAEKVSVAMNVGGVSEAVHDGVEGLLVPAGDFPQFITKLRWLIDNPQSRQVMAERARQTIRRQFTIKGMVSAYATLYAEVLNRPDLMPIEDSPCTSPITKRARSAKAPRHLARTV